jgi:hypothetical protein
VIDLSDELWKASMAKTDEESNGRAEWDEGDEENDVAH